MTKSTSIIFILIFAIILKLEKMVSCTYCYYSRHLDFPYSYYCSLDIDGPVYVHVWIHTVRLNRLHSCADCLGPQRHPMDGSTEVNPKVEIRYVGCSTVGKMISFWTEMIYIFLGLNNPIDVIFHTQPWMALVLLPLAFAFEGKFLIRFLAFPEFLDANWYIFQT